MIDKQRLRPFDYPGLIRLGNETGDGGYVVPRDLVDRAKVMLSLGLAEEWTFEQAVLDRNPRIKIIGVDHSISAFVFFRRLIRSRLRLAYYRLIGNVKMAEIYLRRRDLYGSYFAIFAKPNVHLRKMVCAQDGAGRVSFDTLMRHAGGDACQAICLKMDIEGSEYEILPQIANHAHAISFLAIEFHYLVQDSERFNAGIDLLLQSFDIVHIHANNFGGYCTANDFPDTVEITFVNKLVFEARPEKSLRTYPCEKLDVPNCASRPDYELHF